VRASAVRVWAVSLAQARKLPCAARLSGEAAALAADEDDRELGGGFVPQVAEVLERLPVEPLRLIHEEGAGAFGQGGFQQAVELAGMARWFRCPRAPGLAKEPRGHNRALQGVPAAGGEPLDGGGSRTIRMTDANRPS
jgi:hypothetical protein